MQPFSRPCYTAYILNEKTFREHGAGVVWEVKLGLTMQHLLGGGRWSCLKSSQEFVILVPSWPTSTLETKSFLSCYAMFCPFPNQKYRAQGARRSSHNLSGTFTNLSHECKTINTWTFDSKTWGMPGGVYFDWLTHLWQDSECLTVPPISCNIQRLWCVRFWLWSSW